MYCIDAHFASEPSKYIAGAMQVSVAVVVFCGLWVVVRVLCLWRWLLLCGNHLLTSFIVVV